MRLLRASCNLNYCFFNFDIVIHVGWSCFSIYCNWYETKFVCFVLFSLCSYASHSWDRSKRFTGCINISSVSDHLLQDVSKPIKEFMKYYKRIRLYEYFVRRLQLTLCLTGFRSVCVNLSEDIFNVFIKLFRGQNSKRKMYRRLLVKIKKIQAIY